MASAKILIVEDNPSDVYILKNALLAQDEDLDLEVVSDGEGAMRFVRAQRENPQDWRPRVIVLDLHLPRHDGVEVLQAIREEPVLSHIHVVVVATVASPDEEADLRSMGMGYMVKPNDLSGFARLASYLIVLCKGLPAHA